MRHAPGLYEGYRAGVALGATSEQNTKAERQQWCLADHNVTNASANQAIWDLDPKILQGPTVSEGLQPLLGDSATT